MLSVYPQFRRAQECHKNESNTSKWYHFDCVLGGSVIYSRVASPPKVFKNIWKEIMPKTFSCDMWMLLAYSLCPSWFRLLSYNNKKHLFTCQWKTRKYLLSKTVFYRSLMQCTYPTPLPNSVIYFWGGNIWTNFFMSSKICDFGSKGGVFFSGVKGDFDPLPPQRWLDFKML
jgi:hypothetical protein